MSTTKKETNRIFTPVNDAPAPRKATRTAMKAGMRIDDICVVIDSFSYTSRGRKGKEVYDQFFDALVDAGIGTIVRFDKHVLNGRQRHVLFKQALKLRASKAGLDIHVGGLRIAKDQYHLEAQLLNPKN